MDPTQLEILNPCLRTATKNHTGIIVLCRFSMRNFRRDAFHSNIIGGVYLPISSGITNTKSKRDPTENIVLGPSV